MNEIFENDRLQKLCATFVTFKFAFAHWGGWYKKLYISKLYISIYITIYLNLMGF